MNPVARAIGAAHAKVFGLPPARNDYTITSGIRVPTRDGAELLTDHYAPRGAHRFAAGHRLRVQISGDAHPRFARNPGTGEPLATATSMSPTRYSIRCDRSTVELPLT